MEENEEFMEDFLEVFRDEKTKLWGIRDIDEPRESTLNIRGSDALFTTKEIAERICKLLNKHAIF